MIRSSPEAFFQDMGETLLLIGEEVRPTEIVDDRIDLLAIDQDGTAVVIELKRGTSKLHLLQALSYAAMISKWNGDRLIAERQRLTGRSRDESAEEIEEFLLQELSGLNQGQRIILLAEDFDFAVLITAEWLSERFEMDIRCYRMVLSAEGDEEFLTCTCIYPAPELAQHAVRRGHGRGITSLKWANWEQALETISSEAVSTFFKKELAAGRENYLPAKYLVFRVGGKRRFGVSARQKSAYVWQDGRFADDQTFWTKTLGSSAEVLPVRDGTCLRFYLTTTTTFSAFKQAVERDLERAAFIDGERNGAQTLDGLTDLG
jgi:hypothetical protein